MADNGAGTYTLPQPPFTSGTTISSAAVNSDFSDLATALNNRLTRNGENAASANLPMAGFRHTGVGEANARTQYAAAGQVQDSALVWGGTSTGSANAHAIDLAPGISAYAAGQRFAFLAGYTTTGAATLAVSGLAAKPLVFANGAPVGGGALIAGGLAEVMYDGTSFRLIGPDAGTSLTGNASLATVTATDTTTSRTLADRAADVANIRDEGAVGDGATDCAAALVLAAATGGPVLVPDGDFVATLTTSNSATILAMLDRTEIRGTLALNLAAGAHALASPVVLAGQGYDRLTIIGAAPETLTLSSVASTSGSAGAWSVVLNVASVGGAAVGQYLLIPDGTTGTGAHAAVRGVWKITAVGATTLTVLNTGYFAAWPTMTVTGGSAYLLKTVLKFSNCDGFVVRGAVVGLLDQVAIVGNASDYWISSSITATEKGTFGITVAGETVVLNGKVDHENSRGIAQGHVSLGRYVGISDFDQQGLVCTTGGSAWARFTASCSNRRRGYYAESAGSIQMKNAVANGNFLDGMIADFGGAIICNLSTACGNGDDGFLAIHGGSMSVSTALAYNNGAHGFEARSGATMNCGSSTAGGNASDGFHAEYGGVMAASSCTATGNGNDGFEATQAGVIRADGGTSNTNGRYGYRASLRGILTSTSTLTASGNTTAAKSAVSMGLILDNATYEDTAVPGTLVAEGAVTSGGNITATGYLRSNNGAHRTEITTTSAGDLSISINGTGRLTLKSAGAALFPATDNATDLGRSGERWATVYAGTGAINTSDSREKLDIEPADLGLAFILSLLPKSYRLIDGASGRTHYGLLAQDVEAALTAAGKTTQQFGGFVRSPLVETNPETGVETPTGEDRLGLRYEEFIAPLIKAVQQLEARVAELEAP